MKTIPSLAIAVFAFISLSISAQTKEKSDLNGQTFNITLTQTGKNSAEWQWTTDVLSFKGGNVRSKMMHEHEKFDDAACTINSESSPSGSTMTFKAEKKNAGGAKVKWEGKATGDHIEGTAVCTNEKGNKQSYSFTGTLAK